MTRILTIIALLFATPALGHSGGTDSSGGHRCYTNCNDYSLSYGEYHYHGGRSSSSGISDWQFLVSLFWPALFVFVIIKIIIDNNRKAKVRREYRVAEEQAYQEARAQARAEKEAAKEEAKQKTQKLTMRKRVVRRTAFVAFTFIGFLFSFSL